jgi:hypothetical protein
MITWAGEAPGTVIEKVATQKQKTTHNAVPAVVLDAKGVHASAGGGSIEDQAGLSWSQRAWVKITDFFKGISMWLLVGGLILFAVFILPLFMPFLVPIMAKVWKIILIPIGWVWDIIERIIKWFESKKTPPVPPNATP